MLTVQPKTAARLQAVHVSTDSGRQIRLPAELRSGVERYRGGFSMRMTRTPQEQGLDAMAKVAERFGALAADKRAFHAMLRKVFGKSYDANQAEKYRKQALAGDFTWMPPVRFIASKDLRGAHGAYDSQAGVIYLNSNLLADPQMAAQVYLEEFGHFLDAHLNTTDSAGDEGELFRRLMSGESLSARQINAIRSENDHGTITVDGVQKEVEFWGLGDIGKAISKAVGSVGKALGNALNSAGKAIKSLLRGDLSGALGYAISAGKNIFVDLPASVAHSLVDLAVLGLDAFSPILGSWWQRNIVRRLEDIAHSVVDLALSAWRATAGAALDVAAGFGEGLLLLLRGDIKGGFKRMGEGLVDAALTASAEVLLGLGKGLSAIQTALGLEPPGRKLSEEEIGLLRSVYGDSIDYSQVRIKSGNAGIFNIGGANRPFVMGNTIYMKNGVLDAGVLVHEMAHIWQYQNGGADYFPKALVAQQDDGYNWARWIPNTAWEDLNPEAQAEFLRSATQAGAIGPQGRGRFVWKGTDYSIYLANTLAKIRRGYGAP